MATASAAIGMATISEMAVTTKAVLVTTTMADGAAPTTMETGIAITMAKIGTTMETGITAMDGNRG